MKYLNRYQRIVLVRHGKRKKFASKKGNLLNCPRNTAGLKGFFFLKSLIHPSWAPTWVIFSLSSYRVTSQSRMDRKKRRDWHWRLFSIEEKVFVLYSWLALVRGFFVCFSLCGSPQCRDAHLMLPPVPTGSSEMLLAASETTWCLLWM